MKLTFPAKDIKRDIFRDGISIAIFDNARALKFEKALNHIIMLFGNKFNSDLFGN